ncbi:hypothetical protein ACFP1K_35245, partial [Sphaerisporangium aureirubrum]
APQPSSTAPGGPAPQPFPTAPSGPAPQPFPAAPSGPAPQPFSAAPGGPIPKPFPAVPSGPTAPQPVSGAQVPAGPTTPAPQPSTAASGGQRPAPYPFNATVPVPPGTLHIGTPPPAEAAPVPAGPGAGDETRPPATGSMPTMPGTGGRSRARRWLVPALTVAGALGVSAAVLSMVLQDGPVRPVAATNVPAVSASVPRNDVARWFAFDAPYAGAQFVVPGAPRCGLTSYEGATPDEGRFCVVPWTLSNPGGTEARITPAPPTLVDDRGAEHEPLPVSTSFPATMTPGAKIDGVLVYDLAPARGPATLKLKVSDSKTIEVRL